MKEKKVKILIVTILLAIPFILLTILILSNLNEREKEQTYNFMSDKYKLSKIYDINEFYTVNSCINNYLNHINNLNKNEVMNLLDKKYIQENKIEQNNVMNYIDEYNEIYNYSLNEIEVYFNSYYKIYFTKGEYTKEDDEIVYDKKNISHIIIFDITNNSYSIIPLLKSELKFEDLLKNEYLKNYNYEINNNDTNEILSKNISEFEEAMLYFSKFKNEMINDCDKAYELVSSEITKEKFMNYCQNYKQTFSDSLITKYEKNITSDSVNITINDQYGNKYKITYLEVDKFKVSIMNI